MMHRIQVRNPLPAPATQPTQPRRVKGILLPADQRECPPATHPSYNASSGRHGPIMSLVEIMTSPFAFSTESGPRIPHPEVYMDLIAPTTIGGKSWDYIIIDSLDGLDKQLSQPYILFYPLGSQDGSAFAVNANIRTIQGSHFKAHAAWRGNVVIGKFANRDAPFHSLVDANTCDFVIVRNFLRCLGSPRP